MTQKTVEGIYIYTYLFSVMIVAKSGDVPRLVRRPFYLIIRKFNLDMRLLPPKVRH